MKTVWKALAAVVRPGDGQPEVLVFRHPIAGVQLPKGTVEALLKPENKDKLAAILKYHVVAGRVYSEDALAAKRAQTLEG